MIITLDSSRPEDRKWIDQILGAEGASPVAIEPPAEKKVTAARKSAARKAAPAPEPEDTGDDDLMMGGDTEETGFGVEVEEADIDLVGDDTTAEVVTLDDLIGLVKQVTAKFGGAGKKKVLDVMSAMGVVKLSALKADDMPAMKEKLEELING